MRRVSRLRGARLFACGGGCAQLKGVFIPDHPLIAHKLAHLRDASTRPQIFRELMRELSMLLAYEATRDLETEETTVRTPLAEASGAVLKGKKAAVVSILRAGMGMLEGVLVVLPSAKVGHVGLYRDEETLQPVEYYAKLPRQLDERIVLLTDPMLATGGSAVAAVDCLKEKGASRIKFLSIVSAPEGVRRLQESHPDVSIFTCTVDSGLDERGYILPGLGDAGDRLYGTV